MCCPYHCRRTPVSGPPPRCAPASGPGPCTGCRGRREAAAAASRTARPGGSHSKGCWSEGDCMRRSVTIWLNWGEEIEEQPILPVPPCSTKLCCFTNKNHERAINVLHLSLKVWELQANKQSLYKQQNDLLIVV